MNPRLREIEERLSAIRTELAAPDITDEQLTALEDEVQTLTEERNTINEQMERRRNLMTQLSGGNTIVDDEGNPTTARVIRSFQGADGVHAADPEPEDKYATMNYRRAFMNYVVRGTAIPVEYRADAVTATTDVGVAIPTTVLNQIITKLETVGQLLSKITRTSYRGGVAIPTSSVKPVATWVAKGQGSDKQKQTVDGTVTFAYHKLRCAVAVTLEVDTMAITAFEKLLVNNIVEAMVRALEQSIISGTGVGQPKGIITETVEDGQNVNTLAPAYANLISAEAALPVAYEKGAEWCMSKKTFMGFYGLTDDNGQPIGRINYGIAGKPEYTLLGRPVFVCDYMPSFANADMNSVVAFLFNFKDYILNTNYAMGMKKYEDNETDDQVTKAIMIADGKVVRKGSLVTITKVASL